MTFNDASSVYRAGGFVRAVAAKGLRGSLLKFPVRPLDASQWGDLWVDVWLNRIDGLLAAAVHDEDLPTTPEQRDEVLTGHADAMQLCLMLEADLLHCADILDRAGIRYRVLKGPAFAHLDYPDPALRVFGDIDLLVRSKDYYAAVSALTVAGFKRKFTEMRAGFDHRFGKGVCLRGANGREIDLHRTFVMGPYGLTLDLDDIWSSLDRFEIAGRSFDTLDADQRFLHACYHAVLGRSRTRLSPLRDLAGMLQRPVGAVDLDRTLELSGRWESTAVVARAIAMAWEVFALPDEPLARWARQFSPTDRDRRALRVYLDPDMGYAARQYAALRAVRGVREKAAFAWALAVPDQNYGAGRHHSRWQRWQGAARQIVSLRRTDPRQ